MSKLDTITQVKSSNGANPKQRETLRTLGLGKIGTHGERRGSPAPCAVCRRHLVASTHRGRASRWLTSASDSTR